MAPIPTSPTHDLKADEEQRVAEGSALFQSLVTLHSHVGLLSDVYSSPVFTNPKASQEIVQVFSEEDGLRSIRQLYHFYRVCALESLYFKTAIPRSWIHTKPKKPKASKDAGTDKAALLEKAEIADPMDRRVKNTRYFKYLLSQSTAFIVPIMKGR